MNRNASILGCAIFRYTGVVLFEFLMGLQSNNLAMISDSSIVMVDTLGYVLNMLSEMGKLNPKCPVAFSCSTLGIVCTLLIALTFTTEDSEESEETEGTFELNIICIVTNFVVDIAVSVVMHKFSTPSIQIFSSKSHVTLDTLRTTIVLIQILLHDNNRFISQTCTVLICCSGYYNAYRIYNKYRGETEIEHRAFLQLPEIIPTVSLI